ncbi:hypothetical protein T261_8595 [Streptomyces lydicus]|nr:hypothetical protein T261_8595 [Streptomyces lydicus]
MSIPVTVHAATETPGRRPAPGPRQGRLQNPPAPHLPAGGDEVPYDQVARGYETADGRTVVLTDDDLAGGPYPPTCAFG